MKLINLIVQIFNLRWADKIFVNTFHEYNRFSSFINHVFHYCYIIDEVQKVYNENAKFALWANNSPSYIATYIALILKNVDFYLIPPTMSLNVAKSIIAISDINFIFVSDGIHEISIIHTLKHLPFFKGVYNIDNESFSYIKREKEGGADDVLTSRREAVLELIKEESYNPLEIEEILTKGFRVKKRDRKIAVFSSGTDSTFPHAVYFDDELIYNGLLKLIDSELLPVIKNKAVYSRTNFSDNPIWSILWPLYEGACFSFSLQEANVSLENTHTFEQHWQNVSKEVYEIRFLGKWLLKSNLFWLFKLIARYKLKKYFNFGTPKSAIIVINAFLSPRILKTVVGKLPIYTTYGMQECNQIVAINNFSTNEHKEENCVGELIDGITGSIREVNIQSTEGTLLISADHITDDADFERSVYYDTRDHASMKIISKQRTLVYVYGKEKYAIKNSEFNGSNYENLERILKSVPYFKDVMLIEVNEDLHVLVYPNTDIVEINHFGLLDFKNFVKTYKSFINDKYGINFIKDVKVMSKDFLRTHDGKIKKVWYFMILNDWKINL